jgi:hypothetical protein
VGSVTAVAFAPSGAVNPLGTNVFDKESPGIPTVIPAGDRLRLRHRFAFHKGDEKQAGIAGLYEAYAKETR